MAQNKLWKILKEMGIPDHLTCLLRNLYAGHEAIVRIGYGTTDWFQIGKGVHHLENSAVATGLEKVSFHSNPPKKHNAKECSNYCTIALISHASKVMLKIFQARLQQYMNHELSDVQAGFTKGRGTRDQIANIRWIIEKVREFQKKISFCFIDYAKAFDCVDHNKLWKIL